MQEAGSYSAGCNSSTGGNCGRLPAALHGKAEPVAKAGSSPEAENTSANNELHWISAAALPPRDDGSGPAALKTKLKRLCARPLKRVQQAQFRPPQVSPQAHPPIASACNVECESQPPAEEARATGAIPFHGKRFGSRVVLAPERCAERRTRRCKRIKSGACAAPAKQNTFAKCDRGLAR